jgi:thioredoxin 1
MSVIQINKNNFESLKSESRTVLIDFYADWCGPCRMVSPIVDEIANERADLLVCKVNVDDEPELASQFGVFSIPTLAVMKNGRVVEQVSGARPKAQILELVD